MCLSIYRFSSLNIYNIYGNPFFYIKFFFFLIKLSGSLKNKNHDILIHGRQYDGTRVGNSSLESL